MHLLKTQKKEQDQEGVCRGALTLTHTHTLTRVSEWGLLCLFCVMLSCVWSRVCSLVRQHSPEVHVETSRWAVSDARVVAHDPATRLFPNYIAFIVCPNKLVPVL